MVSRSLSKGGTEKATVGAARVWEMLTLPEHLISHSHIGLDSCPSSSVFHGVLLL